MADKTIKNETLEMREAFEYYYSLGEARGLKAVATFMNKGFASIKRWSTSFGWTERVKQRDAAVGAKMEEKAIHNQVTSKMEYRSIIRELVEKFKQDVIDGKIQIRSVKSFIELAQLDIDLMGDSLGDEEDNMQSLADILQKSAALITTATGDDTGSE